MYSKRQYAIFNNFFLYKSNRFGQNIFLKSESSDLVELVFGLNWSNSSDFDVRMIFMKYSSNSVNALSLADIDKLENSILELEKNHIAKEMIIWWY